MHETDDLYLSFLYEISISASLFQIELEFTPIIVAKISTNLAPIK
jgi:hypothetical protein